MRRPRWSLLAVSVAVAALVVAIPVGRWERSHAAVSQRAGIEGVRALAGDDLFGALLRGRAVVGKLDCLLYRNGGYDYALELCFDSSGRLVRAVDARGAGAPVLWDIVSAPARTPLQLTPDDRHKAADALVLRARVAMATRAAYRRAVPCAVAVWTAYARKHASLSLRSQRKRSLKVVDVCHSSDASIRAVRRQASTWKNPTLDAALLRVQRGAAQQSAIADQAAAELAGGNGVSAATRARAAGAMVAVRRSWVILGPVRRAVGIDA